MRKFKFAKLVRDKIVSGMESKGHKPKWRVLSKSDYVQELQNKILEEAEEIPRTKDKDEVVEEIADVQEVIDNLLKTLNVTKKQLAEIQKQKNAKRGSFKKRHYIEEVETSDDITKWVQYYLDNPDKYPEIK